jgi:5-hydroxyisourate hydrolase
MMGFLTTHVLDTAQGVPAQGMQLRLYRCVGGRRELIATMVTNDDGRCDSPILPKEVFACGQYELEFAAGDYFRAAGLGQSEPAFLDIIPIRFGIADVDSHYHVPLLVSPYSYSTYRGS